MVVGAPDGRIGNQYVDPLPAPPGRAVEVGAIASALDALVAGTGGVVLLSGEGGVGKTTLSAWAAEEARRRGAVVLDAPCFSLSIDTPYACLVSAFGPVVRGERGIDAPTVVGGLSSLGLLFDGIPGAVAPGGDESLNRSRLHGALATVVSRLGSTAPVVLVVDDLHWADAASIQALHVLVHDLPDASLLVVATLRPFEAEERRESRQLLAAIRSMPWCRTIEVGGLDADATAALLRGRLGSIIPTGLVEVVHERSGGTPLVAEALVEVMIDTGVLAPMGRRWELRADRDIPVPAVVDDLIGDRLARLGTPSVELVATVALAAEPVTTEVLARVTARSLDAAGRDLEALRRAGVVDRTEIAGSTAWVVHHPIIGEVAIGALGTGEVEAVHLAFATHLHDAPVDRQGRHLLGAGECARGPEHLRTLSLAGRAALERGAPAEACRLLGAVFEVVDRDGGSDELSMEVGRDLGRAWSRRGEDAVAMHHLERAWRMARECGDLEAESELLYELHQAAWVGDLDGGLDFASEAAALLPRLEAAGEWESAHRLVRNQLLQHLRDGEVEPIPLLLAELERMSVSVDGDEARLWFQHLALVPDLQWFRNGREALDHLVEMRGTVAAFPELHRRVLHVSLDVQLLLGTRDDVIDAIDAEREYERRWGDRPSWRIGLAAWDVAVGDGDIGRMREIEDLLDVVDNARGSVYVAVAQAITDLVRGVITEAAPDDGSTDPVSEHLQAIADVWRGGDPTGAVRCWEQRRFVAGMPMMAPVAAAIGLLRSGDRDGAARLIDELDRFGDGTGRTSAWASVLRGEAATDPPERAGHRADAATRFEALGRPMDAAMCWVAVAEAGGAVPPDRLDAAMDLFSRAPAPWMAERLSAVTGVGTNGSGASREDPLGLTAREREVAEVVVSGLSNREVADRLYISIRTVTSHLDHIYTKLGIRSRAELAAVFETVDPVGTESTRGVT